MPVPLSRFIRWHTQAWPVLLLSFAFCVSFLPSLLLLFLLVAKMQGELVFLPFRSSTSIYFVFFWFDLWSSLFFYSLSYHCNVACHLASQKSKKSKHIFTLYNTVQPSVDRTLFFCLPLPALCSLLPRPTILNCLTDSIAVHNRSSLLLITHTPCSVAKKN